MVGSTACKLFEICKVSHAVSRVVWILCVFGMLAVEHLELRVNYVVYAGAATKHLLLCYPRHRCP